MLKLTMTLLITIGCMLFGAQASAAVTTTMYKGKLAAVADDKSTVTIDVEADPEAGIKAGTFTLNFTSSTKFSGKLKSVEDLVVGMTVRARATLDELNMTVIFSPQ